MRIQKLHDMRKSLIATITCVAALIAASVMLDNLIILIIGLAQIIGIHIILNSKPQ